MNATTNNNNNNNTVKIRLECRDDDGVPDPDSKSCFFHDITTSADSKIEYIASDNKNWLKFKNSRLYQIPPDLFKNYINVQTLDVTACQIENISSDSFIQADNLLYLHMKGNNLTKLTHGVFAAATQLEDLKLQFNRIKDVEEQAFSGLKELRYLYLGKNQINILHDGTFRELVKLETLDLSYNNLMEISDELLTSNKMLDLLDLRGNKLAVIGVNAFKSLEKLTYLDMAGNHLKNFSSGTFMYMTNLRTIVLFDNQLQEIDLSWQDNTGCSMTNNGTKMLLPHLAKVSLAENRWNCSYIDSLLETFETYDIRQLPYKLIHDKDTKVNVKGIACEKIDSIVETKNETSSITKEEIVKVRKCLTIKLG